MNNIENGNLIFDLKEIEKDIDFSVFKNLVLKKDEQKKALSFLHYICLNFLDKDFDDIKDVITDGGDDNNIDIFDINNSDEYATINLFQVKYKTLSCIKKSITNDEVDLFLRSIKDIFIEGVDKKMNNVLKKQLYNYKKIKEEKKVKFNLYLITNGGNLSDIARNKLQCFMDENPVFNVQFLNSYQDLSQNYGDTIDDIIEFPVTENIIKYNSFINSVIVNMRLFDLAKLYEKYGEQLFIENIRGSLKSDINSKIQETIETDPGSFWYKNNGISIICKRFEPKKLEGKNSIEIEGIQIINGGQTTRCINQVYQKYLKNKDDRIDNLYTANVLVKIYQTTDSKLINDITIGTNTQNNILQLDLFSKNENLKKMKDYFEKRGIDLIIKRDKSHKKQKNSIDNIKVFQSYCSIYMHKASIAKNNKTELLKNEFENVFNTTDHLFPQKYFNSYELYKFVKKQISEIDSEEIFTLFSYAIFHLLYLINKFMKIGYNRKKAYETACGLIKIVKNKNKNISIANFFKSTNSVNEIDEEFKKLEGKSK